MDYSITTVIRRGGEFVPIDTLAGPLRAFNYIEGAIVWSIRHERVLSEAHWDLVDQLWAYIVDGAIELSEKGFFRTYFPDQPLRLAFVARTNPYVEIIVGEQRHIVERKLFFVSLADGGTQFFARMCELVPTYISTWKRYLSRISQSLAVHT